MKVVNLETITDMQSRCRTEPHNGSKHIRAKQKLRRKHNGACKSSWSQIGNLKSFYTDNSFEFGKACEDLSWNHCTSTPHRSETNGIAERAVRRVKEGTSAVLLQSGLNENWWVDSMECETYLRNVTVEYYPKTAKDQSRIHQFGKKVLPGLFLGYALYAGGIWKGDMIVADIEELETMDASEIYFKRLDAKEVIFPKENGEFIFPVADGRIKPLGGDQELSTSTLIRERPWRIRRVSSTTSRLISGCL